MFREMWEKIENRKTNKAGMGKARSKRKEIREAKGEERKEIRI